MDTDLKTCTFIEFLFPEASLSALTFVPSQFIRPTATGETLLNPPCFPFQMNIKSADFLPHIRSLPQLANTLAPSSPVPGL